MRRPKQNRTLRLQKECNGLRFYVRELEAELYRRDLAIIQLLAKLTFAGTNRLKEQMRERL